MLTPIQLTALGLPLRLRLGTTGQATTVDDINPALPYEEPNYGNYGMFLIMGNAGSISSTVGQALPGLPQAQPLVCLGPGLELLCDNLKTSTKPKSTERSKSSAKMRKAEIPEKSS